MDGGASGRTIAAPLGLHLRDKRLVAAENSHGPLALGNDTLDRGRLLLPDFALLFADAGTVGSVKILLPLGFQLGQITVHALPHPTQVRTLQRRAQLGLLLVPPRLRDLVAQVIAVCVEFSGEFVPIAFETQSRAR